MDLLPLLPSLPFTPCLLPSLPSLPLLPVCSITTVCDHQSFFHHSSWRFKGSEDVKVQCREGANTGSIQVWEV